MFERELIMEHKFIDYKGHLLLTFPELEELGLRNCMTTADMDVGTSTNGNVDSIKEHFETIYEMLGKRPGILYNGYQEHSSNIELITGIEQGLQSPYGRFIPSTDGLITNNRDIALLTRFADCVPIILFDPTLKVQANIHSGWKGTLQGIGKKGALAMQRAYSSNPNDIVAIIGPSISSEDFEVEWDVANLFTDEFSRIPEAVRRKSEKKYLVDLQKINRALLCEAGIKNDKIHTVPISTFSDLRFHSYRRDKASYGLMGMITLL